VKPLSRPQSNGYLCEMPHVCLKLAAVAVAGVAALAIATTLPSCSSDSATSPAPDGAPDVDVPLDTRVPDTADTTPPPTDTGVDAGDTTPPPACDQAKPFGKPVALTDLNSPLDDLIARLSSDLLTAYIGSDRGGSVNQIWRATRTTPTGTFATPTLLPVVNFPSADTEKPTITGDSLTLYASAFLPVDAGGRTSHIYAFTRTSTGADFGAASPVTATLIAGSVNERDPYVTPDGNELYFCSDAKTQLDIYVSKKVGGVFGAPTRITELAATTVALSCNPFLSADGLTMYFFSNRPPSAGSTDIWVARRPTKTDPFGTPTAVSELNTTENDEPSWLSADGCTLWFSSGIDQADAGLTTGRMHLFRATKPL
jgi:hypothetical protein